MYHHHTLFAFTSESYLTSVFAGLEWSRLLFSFTAIRVLCFPRLLSCAILLSFRMSTQLSSWVKLGTCRCSGSGATSGVTLFNKHSKTAQLLSINIHGISQVWMRLRISWANLCSGVVPSTKLKPLNLAGCTVLWRSPRVA